MSTCLLAIPHNRLPRQTVKIIRNTGWGAIFYGAQKKQRRRTVLFNVYWISAAQHATLNAGLDHMANEAARIEYVYAAAFRM